MKTLKFTTLLIIALLFSACSTTKQTSNKSVIPKAIPAPPEGVTFTTVKNYKRFASIQIPCKADGLSKDYSGAYNDAGKEVPRARFYGAYIQTWSDLSNNSSLKMTTGKDNIDMVFEALKKRGLFGLKSYIEKENAVAKYNDVKIGDKICKRYLISYNITKGNYSVDRYVFGYIIPYKETTAWLAIKDASSHPGQVEKYVKKLDAIFKYMIETVEFR